MKKLLILFICCLLTTNLYAEKITVLLDWFLNPNHAPLFVAQEKGFFKEQNLTVELIGPADPSDPPKLVAAGKADIAIDYQPQFMQQVDQGLPLVSIGSLIDQPMNCLVVLQSSAIHSMKDLKNKTIGQSNSSTNSIMLQTMLKTNHLNLSDVKTITVHYDLTQALLTKKVDAVTGMMRNFEVIQLQLAKQPGKVFYPEKNGVPMYNELIFVINKMQATDPRWKKFLIAVQKGEVYLQKHPKEMWQAFTKAHPELNDELNRRAWFATLPYFAKNPAQLNKKQWENFSAYLVQNRLIEKAQSVDTYFFPQR